MPNETIDLLLSLKPAWAIEVARGDEDARVTADPPPENGLAFGLVRLRLVVTLRGEVKAFEEDGDRRLPASCPERHINADQSFCLGYPPRIVDDAYSASRWWNDLQRFMFLQAVAVETGVWPSAFA
ncbi:MAG: E2 domain-containing protein, partial [Terricaulis sp.]